VVGEPDLDGFLQCIVAPSTISNSGRAQVMSLLSVPVSPDL